MARVREQSNAMAVGNTLMYVAPHMAGAIDVVVVRQPDGSLKSSPFYGALWLSAGRTNACGQLTGPAPERKCCTGQGMSRPTSRCSKAAYADLCWKLS